MSTYYQDIIFLQNSQDFNSFPGGEEGFFEAEEEKQLKYLLQWDTGEGEIFVDRHEDSCDILETLRQLNLLIY